MQCTGQRCPRIAHYQCCGEDIRKKNLEKNWNGFVSQQRRGLLANGGLSYRFSFFEISQLAYTLTSTVITACKEQFARHSASIVHSVTAPYHSKSNGKEMAWSGWQW